MSNENPPFIPGKFRDGKPATAEQLAEEEALMDKEAEKPKRKNIWASKNWKDPEVAELKKKGIKKGRGLRYEVSPKREAELKVELEKEIADMRKRGASRVAKQKKKDEEST